MINQFYIDYIKAIENPDRVGWNGKVWIAPQYKGYDKNQRGYGIDIVKNDSAKRLTQNRPGQWLTEGEADKLMKEHLLYVYGAAQKHIEGFDNLSDKRKAALLGMLYRGDSVNKNKHIININEPDDNKFFESISNYYKSKGLNSRAKNSNNFFNQYQTNFLIPMKWELWKPPMKFKKGGQVRKMQNASGGPIHYSRTMTTDNLSKAANYVGNYVLKGLGAFGKIMTAPFVQLGPTSATIYKSKELLAKERTIENKSEELLGKAMTWVSPLNYGAALATGNGLNARKGEEEVASWSPAWQAVGRLGELYVGPKGAKGVKSAVKAGVKQTKAAVVARKINKVVNETNDLSKLLAFDLFQELTSAPASKITRLRPEFSLAMQDKNYMFGKLLWSTNLTKDRYATSLTKHIKVMDTKLADPQVYVTQALYPLAIKNGGLRAAHGGLTRPIWLNSNKPYFGTPTGVSNSTNYTYIIDANKFTPELNLLRNIGGTHYEYPGTAQLPIEGTKRILWDPVLLQYTSTIFTEAPKSEISSTASLKFFERKPSKISEAERLGIPKGDRGNLSLNLKLAIEDLALYKNSGLYRQVFRVTPDWEDFGWNLDRNNPTFMLLFITDKETMKGPFARVLLLTPTGKGVVAWNPEKNMGGYSSRSFTTPEGMNWAPGEANMMLDGANGLKVILTAPKTDFFDSIVEESSKHLGENLSSTIDKSIMKDFWINSRKVQRPGSYMSGDNGVAPLGSTLIEAFKKKQLYKTPLLERPINLLFIRRTGLSPDSYSSIIRLGNRDGSLRWGEGFTKWNNSAVENKFINDAFEQLKKGEISPEQYEGIFNKWSLKIGGRPLQWTTIGELKIPVHPHPYIYAKKQGGKMNILEFLKNGSGIHIKEKNKGKFTSYCGGKVTSECIAKGKNSSNPAIRKRSTFADNARKWKHQQGGILFGGPISIGMAANGAIKTAKQRLYKNLSPIGYDDLSRIPKAIFLDKPDFYHNTMKDMPVLDEIYAQYLGIPEESRHFNTRLEKSKYKPSQGGEDVTYYRLPQKTIDGRTILGDDHKYTGASDTSVDAMVFDATHMNPRENKQQLNTELGYYTVGRGRDNKGDYVSYYDKWDINPFSGRLQNKTAIPSSTRKILKDINLDFGTPVHIYDRIHFDDYYGIKGDARGGHYLPEIRVYGKKKAFGGKHKEGGKIDFYNLGGWFKNTFNNVSSFLGSDTGKSVLSIGSGLLGLGKGISNSGKITDATNEAEEAINALESADRLKSFAEKYASILLEKLSKPDIDVNGSPIHTNGVNVTNEAYNLAVNTFNFDNSEYNQMRKYIKELALQVLNENSSSMIGSVGNIFNLIQGLAGNIFGNNKLATKGTATGSTVGATSSYNNGNTTTYTGTNGSLRLNNMLA